MLWHLQGIESETRALGANGFRPVHSMILLFSILVDVSCVLELVYLLCPVPSCELYSHSFWTAKRAHVPPEAKAVAGHWNGFDVPVPSLSRTPRRWHMQTLADFAPTGAWRMGFL